MPLHLFCNKPLNAVPSQVVDISSLCCFGSALVHTRLSILISFVHDCHSPSEPCSQLGLHSPFTNSYNTLTVCACCSLHCHHLHCNSPFMSHTDNFITAFNYYVNNHSLVHNVITLKSAPHFILV